MDQRYIILACFLCFLLLVTIDETGLVEGKKHKLFGKIIKKKIFKSLKKKKFIPLPIPIPFKSGFNVHHHHHYSSWQQPHHMSFGGGGGGWW
uniref:Uncharacterized protein n=1 Tax=Tetranychus urticae TaxID=32264 RepID=T1JU43_TETUR